MTTQTLDITPDIIRKHNLTPAEYTRIKQILGRAPNITELGIFSVMWSEHCSYKNSKNVLNAIEFVNKNKGTTIGLTGFSGGKLAGLAKKVITVDSDNMQRIEDVHIILSHLMCSYIYAICLRDLQMN